LTHICEKEHLRAAFAICKESDQEVSLIHFTKEEKKIMAFFREIRSHNDNRLRTSQVLQSQAATPESQPGCPWALWFPRGHIGPAG
jgi:hypothetical protein